MPPMAPRRLVRPERCCAWEGVAEQSSCAAPRESLTRFVLREPHWADRLQLLGLSRSVERWLKADLMAPAAPAIDWVWAGVRNSRPAPAIDWVWVAVRNSGSAPASDSVAVVGWNSGPAPALDSV